jgi:hypothetical protein
MGCLWSMLRKGDSYGVFLEKPGSKRPLGRTRLRENISQEPHILNKKGGRLSTDSFGSESRPMVLILVPERSKRFLTC